MRLFESSETGVVEIPIGEDIQARHEELAARNRELFRKRGIRAFDIAGSVGAGKTSLIAALVERLSPTHDVGVIAGDVATTYDAERVTGKGARKVLQINTGGMCHLDAKLVYRALQQMFALSDLSAEVPRPPAGMAVCGADLATSAKAEAEGPGSSLDIIFIENVGNLICPSYFPLGVEARVAVVSASEGAHVIAKHPAMFQSADLVVLNKIDIAEAVHVDVSDQIADLQQLRPGLPVAKTDCLAGEGIDDVLRALNLTPA